MKIENHLRKINRLEKSILKLNSPDDDYEALVELYMLSAAHCINAALHQLKILSISQDIKHNKLFGFLGEGKKLGERTEEIRDFMKRLDDLRPSHVYGKGENGKTAQKAGEYYQKIKEVAGRIINERKPENSN